MKKEFKTNEEYQANYQKNVLIVKEIMDRINLGHIIKVLFKKKKHVIYSVDGDLDNQRVMCFLFADRENVTEKYVDIAIEELPFEMIEDKYLSLYRKFLKEDGKIEYVQWLENKILEK